MVSVTLAAPFVRKVDIVVGTSPQFFTACAAWAVAAMKRVLFVFELRDMWPESIKAVGAMKDSAAIRFFERVEMFLYRRAAAILSVTQALTLNRDFEPRLRIFFKTIQMIGQSRFGRPEEHNLGIAS